MIVECEKCRSKFNLNDELLKPEGSKVRCSRCKAVFSVYPSEATFDAAPDEVQEETVLLDEGSDTGNMRAEEIETVSLDEILEPEESPGLTGGEPELDMAFEETLDEELIEDISAEAVPLEGTESIRPEAVSAPDTQVEEIILKDTVVDEEPEPSMAVDIGERPLDKKKRPGRRSWFLPTILLVILIIGVFLGIYFYAPGLIPDRFSFLRPETKQESPDPGVRRLKFDSVSGAFYQNEKAGQLYVVEGTAVNNYPASRSYILIKGAILDDQGAVVKQKLVYAGNTFAEEELRGVSLDALHDALKNRFGKDRSNVNIKPGESVPFMIVFDNLPENISEFTVEAVSSSPTK